MKNMSRSKRILCILLAVLILLVACAVFVQFVLKVDIYGKTFCTAYGIIGSMRRGEKGLLAEKAISLSAYPVEDVMAGMTDAVPEYTLWLVNATYPLAEEELENVEMCEIGNGRTLCIEAYENLKLLFAAALEECGDELVVTSAFRTHDEQAAIYASMPAVAVEAGTSEHQCGFAVDVKTSGYGQRRFIMSRGGRWTDENCSRFGFIIRYPYYGKKTTMVTYEPWHLRYVGYPHSEIISRMKITLEDYYTVFENGKYYEYEGYLLSHQTCDDGLIYLPDGYDDIRISPDNMGGYIVTVAKEKIS